MTRDLRNMIRTRRQERKRGNEETGMRHSLSVRIQDKKEKFHEEEGFTTKQVSKKRMRRFM
jgi:hypothetical protein